MLVSRKQAADKSHLAPAENVSALLYRRVDINAVCVVTRHPSTTDSSSLAPTVARVTRNRYHAAGALAHAP